MEAHVRRRVADHDRVGHLDRCGDLGEVVGVVAAGGGAPGTVPSVVGGALGGGDAGQQVEEAGVC